MLTSGIPYIFLEQVYLSHHVIGNCNDAVVKSNVVWAAVDYLHHAESGEGNVPAK